VEGIGFEASLFKRDFQNGADYLNQREEIKKWRNSFLVRIFFFDLRNNHERVSPISVS
jgi:hypothetical protein